MVITVGLLTGDRLNVYLLIEKKGRCIFVLDDIKGI